MFTTAGEAVAWVNTVGGLYVACEGKRRTLLEAWEKARAVLPPPGK